MQDHRTKNNHLYPIYTDQPMSKTHEYLAPKEHYEILDGLRGVASILVVAFHIFETYAGDRFHQIINHGYLAVDFFFTLSGFVLVVIVARVGVPWYFGTHLGLDNGIGG